MKLSYCTAFSILSIGYFAAFANATPISDNSIAMKISGSDQYLRIPNSSSIDLTTGITMEAWARFDGTEATPGMEINMRGNNNQGGYALGINTVQGSGGVFGQFSTGSSLLSTSNLGNTWHSFVWTYDESVSTLYLDGVQIASEKQSVAIGTTTTDLFLGIGLNPDGTWNGATAQGYYDEIRLWNYARTSAQVANTYNTSLIGNEPGLVGYWNFNSGNGNDLSSYHNDGIPSAGVQFVQVPEPASFALIVILGLPLLLRRRQWSRASALTQKAL